MESVIRPAAADGDVSSFHITKGGCHQSKLMASIQVDDRPVRNHLCHGQKSRFVGDKLIPPFNRNPDDGYINPYYWVDEFIPYYMEIMGV